jgi:hypothetical protein
MPDSHTPAEARSKESTPNACHQARIPSNRMKETPALPGNSQNEKSSSFVDKFDFL